MRAGTINWYFWGVGLTTRLVYNSITYDTEVSFQTSYSKPLSPGYSALVEGAAPVTQSIAVELMLKILQGTPI